MNAVSPLLNVPNSTLRGCVIITIAQAERLHKEPGGAAAAAGRTTIHGFVGIQVMTPRAILSHRARCQLPQGGGFRWLVAAVAVQVVLAIYLGWLKWRSLAELGPGGHYPAAFFHLMAVYDWAGAVVGAIALAAAAGWSIAVGETPRPIDRQLRLLVGWLGRHVWSVAGVVTVTLGMLSLSVHQNYPFTMDEFAPALQAEIFAAGKLAGEWPVDLAGGMVSPQYANKSFLLVGTKTGRVCSDYWPGHALLQTPLAAVGMPWLLNPLAGGLALVLIASVAREAFGRRAVGWAMLFTLASPVYTAYSISFYAMPLHLLANLVFARLLLQPTAARAAAAGLIGGFALMLHNPFPHAVFALPWLAWLASRVQRWPALMLVVAGYLLVFVPTDAAWRYVELAVRENRHPEMFRGPVQPSDTVASADMTTTGDRPEGATGNPPRSWATSVSSVLSRLSGYLDVLAAPGPEVVRNRLYVLVRSLAWDSPGLLILALAALPHAWRATGPRLFLCSGLTAFVLYAFVPMSGGHGWGYRYFYPYWACLPIAASGLACRFPRRGSLMLVRSLALAAVASVLVCLPLRLWQMNWFITDHRRQAPQVDAKLAAAAGPRLLVFVNPHTGWFASDLIRNDPFLRHGPVRLYGQGVESDRHNAAAIANARGLVPRLITADARGSVWLLEDRR
jgi:hypothetical protein